MKWWIFNASHLIRKARTLSDFPEISDSAVCAAFDSDFRLSIIYASTIIF